MNVSKAFLLSIFLILSIPACNKALVIEDVNYAQFVESVLIPNEQGIVNDYRNSISFSVIPLQLQEFGEDQSTKINEIRLIRNKSGFYFITADQFKHVYVFEPKHGQLKLKEAIVILEDRLESPAFNWREPYVEILAKNQAENQYLTEKGIQTDLNKGRES